MPLKYDESAIRLKDEAQRISRNLGHFYLSAEHLALAALHVDPSLKQLLPDMGIDFEALSAIVKDVATPGDRAFGGTHESPRYKQVLKNAEHIAESLRAYKVSPVHILLSVLREKKGVFLLSLSVLGIDPNQFETALNGACDSSGFNPQASSFPKASSPAASASSQTPNKSGKKCGLLEKYARDLVALAKEGKMDPIFGRNEEIRRVLQIISRKGKNNPVLIGEAGVGKTAVVFGLAQRIAKGEVPDMLKNKRILDLPMATLVAGAKHRGEFEERLQNIMKEVSQNPDVIVFIDEIHTIVGAGDSRGGMDASNILKPMLARGEFPVLGATTIDEYRKFIEADPALERRFQPVIVGEPSEEDTVLILKGLKERYEKHHGVKFKDEALIAAVKLSVRYLPDRNLPDKAIDLMDESAAKIKTSTSFCGSNQQLFVDEETVAEVVSLWTGIPVSKLTSEEKERLLNLEEHLSKRVIGQDEAVETVSQTIRMVRMGLGSPNRPGGIFLFLGPTGVGKTELAKTLADFLFGSERDMIRIDMSEFMEKHAIARLIGSPPGYVGHEEEGQLTSAVRTKPYSVVLLDEIEKAHPDVFDLFLQVFDDGRLTDSKGRTVNFTNTIIILTSNIGSGKLDENGNSILLDSRNPAVKESMLKELRKTFRPEFINRIDEIILFRPLGREALDGIIKISLSEIVKRAADRLVELSFEPEAIELILKAGYNPVYGARPLKRAVQTYLSKPLAEKMLTLTDGQKYKLKAYVPMGADHIEFADEGEPHSSHSFTGNLPRFGNENEEFEGTYIGGENEN